MKKFTKTLSIVLLVAMCVSMFTISSFAAGGNCTNCGADMANAIEHPEVASTCSTTGNLTYWTCPQHGTGCSVFYLDSYGDEMVKREDFDSKIKTPFNPNNHNWGEEIAAETNTDCQHPGKVAYQACRNGCGKFLVDGEVVTTVPTVAGPHVPVEVSPIAPGCATTGRWSHLKCVVCEKLFDSETEEQLSEADVIRPATEEHDIDETTHECTVCGAPDEDHHFTVSGTNPAEFDAEGSYTYTCDAEHEFESVMVGDVPLYKNVGYFVGTNRVTVMGSAVASLMSGKTSIELTFTADDGCTAGGFTLNSASTTSTVKVDGFEQKGTLKGSIEHVFFTTDDPEPTHVKLFSVSSNKYIAITEYEFTPLGGGRYTYTFGNSFLNKLDAGTYYVHSIFGDGKHVKVGTIIVTNSWQTAGSSDLTFSNSSIGLKEFKYVSGGTRPELYCDMFRDSDAVLQISNDGYSWKNVSVYDYYIEQSNGKDTSYAWIKTSLLDNQKAASNVYFRVIIPAVDAGKSEDVMSNWVKVTTGNNLKAVDTDKHVINSSKSLKFVASVPVDVVKVGTIPLTEGDDYSLSNDGKTITLFADFLNKRTAGSTYTLTAITEEGDEELKTTFKILTTAQASASPRTGDDSNIALWSALVLMSGAAVVAVLPRLKKEK